MKSDPCKCCMARRGPLLPRISAEPLPSRGKGKSHGFTLAELLIATLLLSLVMTAVYTLFHSIAGSWRGIEQGYDASLNARTALKIFQHEVDNLVPGAGHLFEGKEDEVTMFVSSEPMDIEKAEGPHLMRVRYYLGRQGHDKALMREEALVEAALPNYPSGGGEIDPQKIKVGHKQKFVIATHVSDFSINYIWMPEPEKRDIHTPPEPTEPIVMSTHKQGWGLPQALEITLDIYDKPNTKDTVEYVYPLPIRCYNQLRPLSALNNLLGPSA